MASDTDVLIVGGGPAGMMAGLLFARAGVDTLVLEKHGDFLRDFRGDTVHPSTMEIMAELGLLDRFLARPHDRIDTARVRVAGRDLVIGDLRHLATPAPFIAMMPQWEFLDFLAEAARAFPTFRLERQASVTCYVEEGGRMAAVRLADGREVRARRLIIAADGRGSAVRQLLPVTKLGAPMDILWFRVPRSGGEEGLRGIFEPGRILVLIDRGSYWQCALIIPKGGVATLRTRGIAALRSEIEASVPDLGPLAEVLPDFDQLHLLSVTLDRLDRWHRPGLLAIGDAAHAMSPIGGVGINLAIQDAVAAANMLALPLSAGREVDGLLERVQARRMLPTRLVQRAQKLTQDNVIGALLRPGVRLERPPLPLRLLHAVPLLRRFPGRLIGLGFRREHVRSPRAFPGP